MAEQKVPEQKMAELPKRPFEVFEISISVPDIDKAIQQFRDLLDLEPFLVADFDMEDVTLRGKKLPTFKLRAAFYKAGPVELELLGPLDEGDSIYAEYLRKHGPGIQHLGTRVSDLDYEIAWFKERGVEVVQRVEHPQLRLAYVDTEPVCGFHLELVQTHLRRPGMAR